MSCIPGPAMQSCDTGQWIPFFDSCQLITTWMSNTKFYTDSIKVCHFASANMKGWTYVRTILSETKFLGSIDYHIFLSTVLRCARFARARAPLKTVVLLSWCWKLSCLQLGYGADFTNLHCVLSVYCSIDGLSRFFLNFWVIDKLGKIRQIR